VAYQWGESESLVSPAYSSNAHGSDTNSNTLKEAKKYIDTTLPSTIKKLVPDGRPGKLETFENMKDALKGAWLVTEAIPEIKDAKIELLGELDKELREDVIIATNSSSFMASELFEKVDNKDRLVNTHYYMPPDSKYVLPWLVSL
jgi:3-hydroxyacyl-CoA dehydrogenase